MWWEMLIVGVAVAAAGAYVGRLAYGRFRLRGPCGTCGANSRRSAVVDGRELLQINISSIRRKGE